MARASQPKKKRRKSKKAKGTVIETLRSFLSFLQPVDVHHTIPLTVQEVVRMHARDVPVAVGA